MKVDPAVAQQQVTSLAEKAKPSAEHEAERPETHEPLNTAKSRINQWFGTLGVPLDFKLTNNKEKSLAIEKRNRVRAEQRVTNLSEIMAMAMDVTVADAVTEQIDPDWFYAFTDLAENIYSPDMQELWGKILAVEISRPGSFSLRSLETLRRLTQRDAKLFASACRLASRKQGDQVPRIITNFHQRKTLTRWFVSSVRAPVNLANHGLSYPALLALIELGLIVGNEIESAEFPLQQAIQFKCGEKAYMLSAKRNGVALAYYKFTGVGSELFKLTKRHEHSAYIQELIKVLSPAFAFRMQN